MKPHGLLYKPGYLKIQSECCAKEGYCGLARLTAQSGMPLYKMRPKVHLFGHIVLLACNVLNYEAMCTTTQHV